MDKRNGKWMMPLLAAALTVSSLAGETTSVMAAEENTELFCDLDQIEKDGDCSEVPVAESRSMETAAMDYDSVFKVQASELQSFSNNGGSYSNSALEKMFDGDTQTHWETNKQNSDQFKNEVTVTFKNDVELGSLSYYPRVAGAANKGFPKQFSIYASNETEGNNFRLVKEGTASVSSGELRIKLDSYTTFRRLKFVFDDANENWAAGAELMFYKPDRLADKVSQLFTDGTMSQLNAGITLEDVERMQKEAQTHPDQTIAELLQSAKNILQGTDLQKEVFEVSQNGDGVSHARTTLKTSSYGSNLIPLGIAARAGDTIKVYVDTETGAPMPTIVFSQQMGSWRGWKQTRALKQGENIFTIPTIQATGLSVIPGGAIYLENPYTPEQQGRAPRIRIEGGDPYPIFFDGDDVEAFKQELLDYQKKLEAEPEKYVDIVELVSDYAIMNSNMQSAKVFLETDSTPQSSLDFYRERLGKFFAFSGISEMGDDIKHVRNHARANMRLMQPFGFAYASSDHTGFQQGSANTMFQGNVIGWAIAHEIGHHFDIMGGKIPETTNNMWANYNIVDLQNSDDRVESSYDTIFKNHASYNYAELVDPKSINGLAQWWQLHLMNEDYWPNYQSAYRDGIAENMNLTNDERMAVISSYALGVDVTEHFERYKYIDAASAEKVRAALRQLGVQEAAENIKPWYLWTKATRDRVSSFGDQVYNPEILLVAEENGNLVLRLNIEKEAENALLGYEILRDGQVIGFTRTDKFSTTTVPNDGQAHTYKVRAFDLRLNTTDYSKEVSCVVGENADTQNLAAATENMNKIKDALRNAVSAEGVDFKAISQVYVIQPKVEGYQGNETDMLVVQKAEELLQGAVSGTYMATLDHGDYETVDELLTNNLVIMYQEAEGKPFYILKNGEISRYQYE